MVRDGSVIGEGWHVRAGEAHAEVIALRHIDARSATLYVTLEPCCTHGRTPPCTDAIIEAGIRRVVIAEVDPNPLHNGRAFDQLLNAKIALRVGLLSKEASALNEDFNARMRRAVAAPPKPMRW